MSKMAVICTFYGPNGGTGRVTTEIIERYAKEGHDIHVYCAKFDEEFVKTSLVKIHHLPITKVGVIQQVHFLFRASLAVKRNNYDLIYTTGDYYIKPDVVTIHGLKKHGRKQIEQMEKEGILRRTISPLKYLARQIYCPLVYEIGEQLVYRRNDILFVGVSGGASRDFVRCFGQKNVCTVNNGVDFEKNKFNISAYKKIRSELGIKDNQKVLLFVGSEWIRKRLDVAISACAKMENTQLIVLGHDEIGEYKKMAENLKCDSRVHFLGFTKNVEDYYSASDYFLFPTAYETFGLVALEAMAAGCVVIANPVNGVCDYIKHKENGFLVKKNIPDEYVDLIHLCEKNEHLRKQVKKNAVQTASTMTWEDCYQGYKTIFDKYMCK